MVHIMVFAEGYTEALRRFEKYFHEKPYPGARSAARVRELKLYDFTCEESAREYLLADLNCFFNNHLGKQKDEEHGQFKKHKAFQLAMKFFYFFAKLGRFNIKPVTFKQHSFYRDELAEKGEHFLIQGWIIGEMPDRKDPVVGETV